MYTLLLEKNDTKEYKILKNMRNRFLSDRKVIFPVSTNPYVPCHAACQFTSTSLFSLGG